MSRNTRYLAGTYLTQDRHPELYSWARTVPRGRLAEKVATGLEIVRYLESLPGADEFSRKGFLAEALKLGLLPVPGHPRSAAHATPAKKVQEPLPSSPPEASQMDLDVDEILGLAKVDPRN